MPARAPKPAPVATVLGAMNDDEPVPSSLPDMPEIDVEQVVADVLRAIVADADAETRPASVLFQDFQVRCRMVGVQRPPLDLSAFARRLAAARAGIFDGLDDEWAPVIEIAEGLPDDMWGAFLLVARAARESEPCPSDSDVARIYGTSSLGRARRVMSYMEGRHLFVTRVDLSGKRSITIPRLGWTTQPADAA